ncbi:MAG: STAS domain-containing protein [Xanthomonadales bacterium]|nr:STAS domain-containing protein [Xanthomonadales bacterium]
MSGRFVLTRSGPARIEARGRIDTANAAEVLREGDRAIEAPVVVDLAALESADSVTLAVLLAWAARSDAQGRVTFAAMPPHLGALARLSGVEGLLGIAGDARAA